MTNLKDKQIIFLTKDIAQEEIVKLRSPKGIKKAREELSLTEARDRYHFIEGYRKAVGQARQAVRAIKADRILKHFDIKTDS